MKWGEVHSLETPGLSLSLLCPSINVINSLQETPFTFFPNIY